MAIHDQIHAQWRQSVPCTCAARILLASVSFFERTPPTQCGVIRACTLADASAGQTLPVKNRCALIPLIWLVKVPPIQGATGGGARLPR